MERMFLNPMDGEIYPESHYHRENVDLSCVIEAHKMPDGIWFDIRPENIERMEFKDIAVIELIANFTSHLARHAIELEDPEEAAECASVAAYVSRIMMEKLSGMKMARH
jgi:methyl coenzyme M reductase subunit C